MVYQRKSIYGVGVNDWHTNCNKYENGKKLMIKEYKLWRAMLTRSYSEYTKNLRPTYRDVTCTPEWLYMTKFIHDVSQLVGYDKSITDGWVLDKDILVKGNKLYSKETCCFVPSEINVCLTTRTLYRGDLPLGVTKTYNGKELYKARCGYNGKRASLGVFTTPEDAFEAYRVVKKMELKRLADKYKELIADNVYEALINYDFTLED